MAIKAVELTVSGEVQGVGYRRYAAKIAQRLKLSGFAENLPDGTVRIKCKGDASIVEKFKESLNVHNPPEAPLINVETIRENTLKESDVPTGFFEEVYNADVNKELIQAISTGSEHVVLVLRKLDDVGNKIDGLGNKIDTGFNKMGDKIDDGFNKTDTNFGVLAGKYGKISNTMERIDKNIEKLAKKRFQ